MMVDIYADFDAFIVLHGADTMSFTASALSFMIDNLKKTVIFTGALGTLFHHIVPIGEIRNYAINNLLCFLVIPGHYKIPEVLMRGQRNNQDICFLLQLLQQSQLRYRQAGAQDRDKMVARLLLQDR
jgi:hypothetical protein